MFGPSSTRTRPGYGELAFTVVDDDDDDDDDDRWAHRLISCIRVSSYVCRQVKYDARADNGGDGPSSPAAAVVRGGSGNTSSCSTCSDLPLESFDRLEFCLCRFRWFCGGGDDDVDCVD